MHNKICKNCNNKFLKNPEITYKQWKYTKFCSRKCKNLFMKGINAPGFKDGRTLNKYYCKCGNKINWATAIFGRGMCRFCMTQLYTRILKGRGNPFYGRKHTKATKNKMSQIRINSGLYIGKNNPAYINGKSKRKYPRDFSKKLKYQIFKRDNFICQICQTYPCNDLVVHHIDYNKKNNSKDNLITTCRKCNSKINFNRKYWQSKLLFKKENINE